MLRLYYRHYSRNIALRIADILYLLGTKGTTRKDDVTSHVEKMSATSEQLLVMGLVSSRDVLTIGFPGESIVVPEVVPVTASVNVDKRFPQNGGCV